MPNQSEPFLIALEQWLMDNLHTGDVYPNVVPEDVSPDVPRLVYTPIVGKHDLVLRGASGVYWIDVQIDAYGPTHADVLVLQEQLRVALQDYTGMMGSYHVCNAVPTDMPTKPKQKDTISWNKRVEYRIWVNVDVPVR